MTKRGVYESKSLAAIVKSPDERKIIAIALKKHSQGVSLPKTLSGPPPNLDVWWPQWTSGEGEDALPEEGKDTTSGTAETSSGGGGSNGQIERGGQTEVGGQTEGTGSSHQAEKTGLSRFPKFGKKKTTTSNSIPLKRNLDDAPSTVSPKRPRLIDSDRGISSGSPMDIDQETGGDEVLCTHFLPSRYFVQS